MDKDAKSGASALSGNGMLAVLLLAAGAFVLHDRPLQGTRPAANESKIDQRFAEQDVDARLWQDPFGAVERGREELAKKIGPEEVVAENDRHDSVALRNTIAAKAGDDVLARVREVDVLAVMVPGGPYAEQVEARRRTRYAVLAGLNASHYAPIDTEHIGYLLPSDNARLPHELPQVVPYEWFEAATDRAESPCWSRRAPTAPDAQAEATPGCRQVLVLWLDSGAFGQRPFARMASLFGQLLPRVGAAPVLRWRVLGPPDSGILRAMVEESSARDFDATFFCDHDVHLYSPWATVPDAVLLARVGARPAQPDVRSRLSGRCARPSVALDAAGADGADAAATLAGYFEARGISLVRTIGDDQKLAASLIEELDLRLLPERRAASAPAGRKPSDLCRDPKPNSPPHIAVITELDTLYGRSLRRQFEYDASGWTGLCVDRFQYVRGIDGQLPQRSDASAAAPAKEARDAKSEAKDKDGSLIERAEGQSQYDYLRRLARRLRERDAELRRESRGSAGILAIGVLGNDLHDKLLVLQALKPEFPDAVFFTTDLDVRFLHPREQGWTRNLVVASNFDLRLTDRLQSGAPPFRDSYQTSTFFATSLAMAEITNVRTFRWSQSELTKRLHGPRVFEIGRTAAFAFAPASPAPAAAADPACERSRPACVARSLAHRFIAALFPAAAAASPGPAALSGLCGNGAFDACADIHPTASRAYPDINLTALVMGFCTLVLLLWAPALAVSPALRQRIGRLLPASGGWPRARAVIAALLIVQVALPVALALGWPAFAQWLTEGGKPISFSEGISIWPTEAIRFLTLVLCVFFVFHAWTALARNLDELSEELQIGRTRAQLVAEQDEQDRSLAWWQKLANMFRLNKPYDGAEPANAVRDPMMSRETLAFWKRYIVQNRASSRAARSAVCAVAMLLLGFALYQALGQSPGIPVRGGMSAGMHGWLALLLYLAMNFLVFFVADATRLSVRLVREVRRRDTSWPEQSVRSFQARLGALPIALIDHWIDLQFIARRTRCVTKLVYYPCIIVSLLLLSRSTAFDNWRMPLAVVLMALLDIAIVVGCVVALRRAAEHSRTRALTAVEEALLRARAGDALGEPAPQQLELLRGLIENLREGAFAPFSQQPLLKAALMPFASLGGPALLEYMAAASI